jgi:hypothetical protein
MSRPSTPLFVLMQQDVDATELGLARVLQVIRVASRVNPTCDDKRGHDGACGLRDSVSRFIGDRILAHRPRHPF